MLNIIVFLFWQWQTDTIIVNTVKYTHCVVIWIAFRCMSQKENKKKYLEEYRVTTWALFECVFYKFAAPCGWLSDRCCEHFGSQPGSYQRNRRGSAICKKRFQKCGVSPWILINSSSYLLSDSYNKTLFKPLHSVYILLYWR